MSDLRRLLRVPTWAWPLLAVPVVGAVEWWTYRTVSAEMRGRLEGRPR